MSIHQFLLYLLILEGFCLHLLLLALLLSLNACLLTSLVNSKLFTRSKLLLILSAFALSHELALDQFLLQVLLLSQLLGFIGLCLIELIYNVIFVIVIVLIVKYLLVLSLLHHIIVNDSLYIHLLFLLLFLEEGVLFLHLLEHLSPVLILFLHQQFLFIEGFCALIYNVVGHLVRLTTKLGLFFHHGVMVDVVFITSLASDVVEEHDILLLFRHLKFVLLSNLLLKI